MNCEEFVWSTRKMLSPQKLFFKSLVPEISSNENIQDLIGYALAHQEYFERNVSPYEEETFKNDVLNFVIESEKIDRLYYIYSYEENYDNRYELYCRMLYKETPYYVSMSAYCEGCGWDCRWCSHGHIKFTKFPNVFFDHVICRDFDSDIIDKIYTFLQEDGYKIPKQDPLYYIPPKARRNVSSLKLLCHEYIYSNKDVLCHYKSELPQVLIRSVNEYIMFKNW